ncbi:hypothetical protein SNEBB_004235 [Seison nebaliae]|nr:hypothetical protein SNEBB_004235 [Seison nebaliae]
MTEKDNENDLTTEKDKSQKNFILAAVLLNDAVHGRHLVFEETRLRNYVLLNSKLMAWISWISILALFVLTIYENPALYPIHMAIPLAIEFICLSIQMSIYFLSFRCQHDSMFWKDKKHVGFLIVCLLTLVDMIAYILCYSLNLSVQVRITRILRITFILTHIKAKNLRFAFRNIRQTIPDILHLLILIFCSILFFTLLSFQLFRSKNYSYANGEPYFRTFIDSFWDLYVLLTTSNSPDVMVPAYNHRRLYILFFILYIVINLYIFMSIFLAIVYENYQKHFKVALHDYVLYKRTKLDRAFSVLAERKEDISVEKTSNNHRTSTSLKRNHTSSLIAKPATTDYLSLNKGFVNPLVEDQCEMDNDKENDQSGHLVISYNDFLRLMTTRKLISGFFAGWFNWRELEENSTDFETRGNYEKILTLMRWLVLNTTQDDYITKNEFMRLADIINVRISSKSERSHWIRDCLPAMYDSVVSRWLRKSVRSKLFRLFFDIIILLNGLFLALKLDEAEYFFLSIFTLELLLKLYSYGFDEFRRKFWNIFDLFIVITALAAVIIEHTQASLSILDIILIIRMLRLLKIFGSIKRFRLIIMTLTNIAPSILTYIVVLLTFYYIYAIIGMEAFNDFLSKPDKHFKHMCLNPKLNGSDFCKAKYYNSNFNNILQSFVILFELTVVNQWHVITSGFVKLTSKWARLYFITFHMTNVLLIMNIFTAFILDAFLMEIELKQTIAEDQIQKQIMKLGIYLDENDSTDAYTFTEIFEIIKKMLKKGEEGGAGEISSNNKSGINDLVLQMLNDHQRQILDLTLNEAMRFHISKKSHSRVEVLLQRLFESSLDEKS